MNTPNKLTILRMCLIPFFVVFLTLTQIPLSHLWALIIFVIASITDALDGNIARKNNLVTNFGKFLDPIADKLLVVSALLCFVKLNLISAVVVIVIVAREFLVSSLRLIAVGGGKVIAASIWGKMKTVTQMVAIITIMFLQFLIQINVIPSDALWVCPLNEILMWISAVFTIVSGAQYLMANKEFIDPNK
jgi:CDP-diacylglycerol--glycerol-3-phosphate 3-phosphatidyltransferase